MKHTANCIFCGKVAEVWCGCVTKDGEAVLAGMCVPCSTKSFAPGNFLPPKIFHETYRSQPIDIWREEYGLLERD